MVLTGMNGGRVPSPSSPPPIRVLLVEDSVPVRQRIRSMIEEADAGAVVGETGSVAAAVGLFLKHQPDAVVLDLSLTDGSGLNVLRQVKSLDPGVSVVVLTNYASPESREQCLGLGADHYFDKSMEFERVPEVLRDLLGGGNWDARGASR